eukprot:7879414-Alexandrium_andersonii.AAC.1
MCPGRSTAHVGEQLEAPEHGGSELVHQDVVDSGGAWRRPCPVPGAVGADGVPVAVLHVDARRCVVPSH